MARRMVDGSFFTNERIGRMPPLCRLFLLGLIANVADDQGRMSANPALLRATVLPFEDISLAEVRQFLEILIENNTLIVHEADGKLVAQLVNWWQYQEQMQYAAPSKLLPPEGWKDRIRLTVGRGKAALTYGWHLRDGSVVADTCDRYGRPLPSSPSAPPEPPPVQAALGLDVKTAGIASNEETGTPKVELGVAVAAGAAPVVDAATTARPPQWAIMSDDLPSGPKHLRNLPQPPPIETRYTNKAVKASCLRLEIEPRKFVDGKIPKGAGKNKFEIFYEFVSIHTVKISDYNRDRIDEAVTDEVKWRMVLEAWFGVQNKPDNFTGQLQWYREGIPSYAQTNKQPAANQQNGKPNPGGNSGQTGAGANLGQRATIDFNEAQQLFGRHRGNKNGAL